MASIRDFEPDSPISKILAHLHIDTKYIPHKCEYKLKCKCCDKIFEFSERDVFDLNEKDLEILMVLDKLIQANSKIDTNDS